MSSLGLTHTFADHSIYVYEARDSVVPPPLYVDDLLIGYCDDHQMEQIRSALEQHYKMVDAGPASWVLGMHVTNDTTARCITLDHSQYILKVLKKFSMSECKPTATPLPKKTVLQAATNQEAHDARSYPCLQVIGSVMYVMLGTRPDIAYAVSTLS